MIDRWIVDPSESLPLGVIEDTEDGEGVCALEPAVARRNASTEMMMRAYLIAAAPDMLAALRVAEVDVAAYCDRLYRDGPRMAVSFSEAQGRLATIRAAIAKAEGRT